MIEKVNIRRLQPKSLLLLIFFLSYLMVIISACGSEISTPPPALEPEKTPPSTAVVETPEETVPTGNAEGNKKVFIAKACTGCHTIHGVPEAQGKVGPELTHWASNPLIVDVLPNTEENLKKYLRDPTAVKPRALMPNQYLTDSELDALVAFLQTLK